MNFLYRFILVIGNGGIESLTAMCCSSIKEDINPNKNHLFSRMVFYYIYAGNMNNREQYNQNPNKCLNCDKIIFAYLGDDLRNRKRQKFCSRPCSASFNNKRKGNHLTCLCGNKKDHRSKNCVKCYKRNKLKEVNKSSIKDFLSKGNARVKYSWIRSWVRKSLLLSDKPMECIMRDCSEFKEVLEVSHTRSIASFDEFSLMGEVNHIDNLEWICPSHHALYEKGIIDLNGCRLK